MSYLQAFNFSNPFSVPNYAGFNFPPLGGGAPLQQHHFSQTLSPASTTYTRTAGNQLLVNSSPHSPAAEAAASIPIPESIVPNYNSNSPTDYYGNRNQNFANQQAPIPPEYQQQQQKQHHHQDLALQLRPQVVQPIPEGDATASDNGDGFDVIIHDTARASAEQSEPIDPQQQRELQQELLRQPPSQISRNRRRGKNRNPPRVINYAPVQQVHYVPPVGLGPHHVSFHAKQKFSVHDVIEHHDGDEKTALKITTNSDNGYLDVNIDSVGGANGQLNLNNAPTINNNSPLNNDNGGPSSNGVPSFNIRQNINDVPSFEIPQGSDNVPTRGNNAPSSQNQEVPRQLSENNNLPQSNLQLANNNEAPQSPNGLPSGLGAPEPKRNKGNDESHEKLRVTPIQGPIFAKDGHVPVVPLYSYNSVKNGTYYQIPILWTALSYALGLEVHGEILRGLPCIKRLNQLYCPSAGQSYPLEKIEGFIDENKALIRRMYGEFIMSSEAYVGPPGGNVLRRSTRDIFEEEVPEMFSDAEHKGKRHPSKRSPHHHDDHKDLSDTIPQSDAGNGTSATPAHVRTIRQTVNNRNGSPSQQPRSNRVDSCESTVEIVTPYWAANSGGKVRAIVNTQHFEQAIHQEVCRHTSTRRCSEECGCEQKYKWHRLLAYDPDNDCRGIFMDWFLFPSCCVCRCNPQ